jgi:hypothetical protein
VKIIALEESLRKIAGHGMWSGTPASAIRVNPVCRKP